MHSANLLPEVDAFVCFLVVVAGYLYLGWRVFCRIYGNDQEFQHREPLGGFYVKSEVFFCVVVFWPIFYLIHRWQQRKRRRERHEG